MAWKIENHLQDRARVARVVLRGVEVRAEHPGLQDAIAQRSAELSSTYTEPSEASEALAPARRLYHGLGIDPSKRRPSSEALLRRVIQGKGLYTVNTAVDAANLASLTYLLPVGLYDLDEVESSSQTVVLRLGHPGEEYEGIRKGMIHVGERPTLADDLGAFGNPSSDSLRTCVTEATRTLLFVIYGPADTSDAEMERCRVVSEEILQQFLGGEPE